MKGLLKSSHFHQQNTKVEVAFMSSGRIKIDWQEALQQFLFFKKAAGRRDQTIKDYEIQIKHFFKLFPNCWEDELKLRQCFYEYLSHPIKPATYNLRLTYLKAFFRWCVEEGYLLKNPAEGLSRKKTESRIVNIDPAILQKLIQLPDRKTFCGLRDYALILLTLDTGIRPKEAFSLLIEHFDFKTLQVCIPSEISKTGVTRVLPILPVTANAIKKLIATRHPEWDSKVPVFCTVEGKPLTRSIWSKRLNEYSKQLGVKIRPYDLRHTFALLYLKNGGYELSLQRTLGHTTLEMTKRYVHFTQNDLREINNTASPLNMLLQQTKRVKNKLTK